MFKILSLLLVGFFSLLFIQLDKVGAYYFGLKSADNTPENIESIEKNLEIKLPIVSFIFDPRETSDVLNSIDRIVEKLGTDRIYHFTISPDNFSAKEVAQGAFDTQYLQFFEKVKKLDLHVIFRTMHEMNGGRYTRGSDPENFKLARVHVWELSRIIGLDQNNIVFDFSVNHRDMPTKSTPSQTAPLVQCSIGKKDCARFEDYYPGDEYVDVVGFSFYNRGKAAGDRQWLSPVQILYDKRWKTYERLEKFGKPIIIDEVATTSVRYSGKYNAEQSRQEYLNHDERKNLRLNQLWQFIVNHPEIVAALYFNVDYTKGLNLELIGEADRAVVNLENNKIYHGFRELQLFGNNNLEQILKTLFNVRKINIDGKDVFVSSRCIKEVQFISSLINEKSDKIENKVELIEKLQKIDFGSVCINKSLNALSKLYHSMSE